MEWAKFAIEDMSCGHCVRRVSDVLRGIDGVAVPSVAVGSADVSYDPAKTSPPAIAAAITAAGYPAKERQPVADRLACRTEPGQAGGGCCCG